MAKRSAPDDLVDATLIAQIIDATAAWEAATGRPAPQKVLREALWFYWQNPRSGLCVRGKYPIAWPWTAAARAAIAADPKAPLVVEHVVPVSLVIRHLLDQTPWAPERLAEELHRLFVMAVITPAEHLLLGAGDLDDPWSRYAAAGLNDLAPLIAEAA